MKNQHTDLLIRPVLGKASPRYWITVLLLGLISAWGLGVFIYQLRAGLGLTGMNRPVNWGLYIINFVFFIGLAHSGTFISAILRLVGAEWRRPITRLAEAITVFSLPFGAGSILVDLGRLDRVFNLLWYGRFQSPLLWDVTCVSLYLLSSVVFFYLSMIPDIAVLRDRLPENAAAWKRKFYTQLALGWQHTPGQYHRLEKVQGGMAVFLTMLVVTVHTVVSWIFGMTLQPGWHTAILGPFFLVGAIFSGTGAVVLAMAALRWLFGLEEVLTRRHFDAIRKLLIALALVWFYFMFAETLTTFYGNQIPEMRVFWEKFSQAFAPIFWVMFALCFLIPLALMLTWGKRSVAGMVAAGLSINLGMWLERLIVIVPTETRPRLLYELVRGTYAPTWVEWSITAACFAGLFLLYLLFLRLFPIIPIWETAEELPGVEKVSGIQVSGSRVSGSRAAE